MAQTGGLSICLTVSRFRETPSDNGRDLCIAWPRSRQSQLADRPHSTTRLSLRSLFASGAVIPALFAVMASNPARASCTITTSSATCDGAAAPPTYTGPVIGSGPATANGFTINLINNAQINISTPNVNQNAISLGNAATINLGPNTLVQNNAVTGGGLYGTGNDTIEVGNNSSVTIAAGAKVISAGTQTNAEPINPEGSGNTITNNGLIQKTAPGAAIYFQNNSGTNTVVNNATGVIQVASGSAIGGQGIGAVDFTNRGTVIGNLAFGGGNDTLNLFTGSTVTGSLNGGGGTNAITLDGTGTASLPGTINNFQTLTKVNTGTWQLTGVVSGGLAITVANGNLTLSGNSPGFAGSVLVNPLGTLQLGNGGTTGSIAGNITDNGLVAFNRSDTVAFAGVISGTGAVSQAGTGTTVLTKNNTYSGGTFFNAGILQISSDANLGSPVSGVIFNGGTLQLGSSLNLAPTRPITLNAAGGMIDTQGFTSTIAQGISGLGALSKAGAGTLLLTGDNTYSGGTTIGNGTLQLGNGGITGSVIGNITDNAALAINRSSNITLPGVISGSGSFAQNGTGTTILTENNTYTGGTTINNGTLQLGNGGSAGNVVGDIIDNAELAINRSNNVTLPVITGTGSLAQIGTGISILSGNNSYSGGTSVTAGTLQAGAVNSFSPNSAVNVAMGGTLNLAGFDQTVPGVIDAGFINMGTGTPPGTRLTIAGNYIGGGGTIALNTLLGSDGAPSDRLVISGGAASGSSFLRIINAGGLGALTTGNGILVVNTINGGTTAPGAFALTGLVAAGPYDYTLVRGSVDASNSQAWYLRSTLDCTLAPTILPCNQPDPGAAPPDFRPETSLYAAIPSMTLLYGRNLLDTLQERVGDEEDLRNRERLGGVASGGWGRIIGQHGNDEGDPRGIFGDGPKFNYDIGAFQGGQDLLRRDGADGSRDHAGLYAAVGLLNGGVTHFDRSFAGTDSMNAYSLGGYWTHFGAPGWYLDAILQGTWYDVRAISGRLPTLTTSGWGFASSLEAGYPIKLRAGWLVEPQAQIVFQTVSLGDSNDTAAIVQFRDIESVAARIGTRFARSWSLDDDPQSRSITVWIRPSFWNEFRGNPQTLFSSAAGPVPFQSNISGSWFEINGGLDARITQATAIFANVGYQVSVDRSATAYNGKMGLRVAW